MSARTNQGGNAHQIAVGVAAILKPELKRIETRLDRLVRAFRNHDRKADGEADAEHPWLLLERARCCQVEEVYKFMLAHASEGPDVNTIPRACRETFVPIKSGYKTVESLQSYCYRLPITDYL